MDVEFWILATAPILALVAVGDAITHFTLWLTKRIGNYDPLWAHLALLFAVFIVYVIWLYAAFDMGTAFFIKDYLWMNDLVIRAEGIIGLLLIIDTSLLAFSILAVVFPIWRGKHNLVLSALATIFGNVGTLVWMMNEPIHWDNGTPRG